MPKPSYRENAIDILKIVGKELTENAEEYIPDLEAVKNIDVWIRIPSLSDDPRTIPEIEVSTTVYPKYKTISQILEVQDTTDEHTEL